MPIAGLPAPPEGVLRATGLRLARSGRVLLDVPAFAAAPGVTAILGANGAGKSLLLRVLAGLRAPDAGEVTSEGGIGLVFQRPVMLRRSVAANLDFALRAAGRPRSERRTVLPRLLETGGFADPRQGARTLSGGEQQRLAVLRALAAAPALLLMDEPCAALDPHATAEVERLIRRAEAAGTRILLVTHDVHQARRLGRRTLFLAAGRIVEESALDDLASPEARAYLTGELP